MSFVKIVNHNLGSSRRDQSDHIAPFTVFERTFHNHSTPQWLVVAKIKELKK